MKRLVILSVTAALALPLVADEPKKSETAPAQTQSVAPATDDVVSPNDSPLVAASKRSKRRNKKAGANVITNETLKASKGHVTTTTNQREVNVPVPSLTPHEEKLQEQKDIARAEAKVRTIGEEQKKKAEEEQQRKLAAAAGAAEEGMFESLEGDPATAEAAAEDAAKQQKPPQH